MRAAGRPIRPGDIAALDCSKTWVGEGREGQPKEWDDLRDEVDGGLLMPDRTQEKSYTPLGVRVVYG